MKAAASQVWMATTGSSPETVALILSLGLVLGTFPVVGCPTLLCAVAAVVLRLNLPAVQLVNQLSSPLQWALLIPFARIGSRILGGHGAWSVAGTARDAIIGWFCFSLPLGLVLYFLVLFALRRSRPQCCS